MIIIGKVSESQKKARDRWDGENMATLGCKVRKEQAERFKAVAASQGKRAKGLLKEFVLKAIDETEGVIEKE